MSYKLMVAGAGGQGVMLIGQLLGYTATAEGKYVTYFPAYGSEQRGGTANTTVVISDEPIGSPKVEEYDGLIIMNQPSFNSFAGNVLPTGKLFVNSSMVEDFQGKDVCAVDCLKEAIELGAPQAANMIMLGFFITISKVLPMEAIAAMVEKKLGKKPEMIEINRKALARGQELAKAYL